MVAEELRELIQQIQERGCEEQSIEVKAAHIDCPKKLYDTISAFANQNIGGTFFKNHLVCFRINYSMVNIRTNCQGRSL